MTTAVKKYYKLHTFVFAVLSVHLFLLIPIEFINKSLAVIICIGVLLHLKDVKFEYNKWYEKAMFLAVNIHLTLAVFGYDLFLADSLKLGRLSNLVCFVFGFIWSSYVLQSALDALKHLGAVAKKPSVSSNNKYWLKWLVLLVIMFAIFIIWQRAYNPIVLSPDSRGYLFGWHNGTYDSFRSPVYSFLISLVCHLAPTKPEVQWIAFAQNLVFSSLLATILMYLHKKCMRFRYIILAAVILPLIPSLGLHTIIVWCDLACGMTMLWFTYVLVRILDEVIVRNTASKKQQISFCVQLCISLILAYFIRSNSFLVYLVMAPVLVLLFIFKKKWKLLVTVALSVVAVLLIRFPGYNALQVNDSQYTKEVKYYAGLHDIQAVYYSGGKLSDKTLASLRKYVVNVDDPEIRKEFKPDWVLYQAIYYKYNCRELTMSEFLSMYMDSFIHNPFKTARSIMHRCRAYWVIAPKAGINCVNATNIFDSETQSYTNQAPEIGVYRNPNILTDVMNEYITFMIRPIPSTFVWRYGFWTLLMIISVMTLILKKKFIWLLAYLPVFVYLSTLLLTNGWTDYRYGLPVFFTGMFLPLFSMLSASPDDNKTSISGGNQ